MESGNLSEVFRLLGHNRGAECKVVIDYLLDMEFKLIPKWERWCLARRGVKIDRVLSKLDYVSVA